MRKEHKALEYTAIAIAVIALIISVSAYYRATQPTYYGLEDQIELRFDEAEEELELAIARAEARAELLAIRTEIATQTLADDAAARVAMVQESLADAYGQVSEETVEGAELIDARLEALELALREGGVATIEQVDDALAALEGQVRESKQQQCREEGGEWRQFPNGCVDSCNYARNPDVICTQALTMGCDCGPEQCWNGAACVPN